jgi:membrane dipeptidase
MLIVDAHLDLAYNHILRGRDITRPAAQQPVVENEIATVGLPDLRAGSVAMICATIFAMPRTATEPGYVTPDEAQIDGWNQLKFYLDLLKLGLLDFVTHPDEVPTSLPSGNAIPAILLLEGADPIRFLDDLPMWYDTGLRVIGLAWRQTRFAGGTGAPGPLTPDGIALVRAMDKLGMIHDTSHLAEESFWQLLGMSSGPVFASHSNCRSIVPTDRQLSDAMISALANRGGVVGINFFDKFLMPPELYKTRRCDLSDLVRHVDHICQLTGSATHVGLGSDMDGGLGREQIPHELPTSAHLPRIAEALAGRGYSQSDIDGIMGGNFLRFFRENLPKKHRAADPA